MSALGLSTEPLKWCLPTNLVYVDMIDSWKDICEECWSNTDILVGNPFLICCLICLSLQDALPVGWRMDFVCTTQILSKRRRNKVTVNIYSCSGSKEYLMLAKHFLCMVFTLIQYTLMLAHSFLRYYMFHTQLCTTLKEKTFQNWNICFSNMNFLIHWIHCYFKLLFLNEHR